MLLYINEFDKRWKLNPIKNHPLHVSQLYSWFVSLLHISFCSIAHRLSSFLSQASWKSDERKEKTFYLFFLFEIVRREKKRWSTIGGRRCKFYFLQWCNFYKTRPKGALCFISLCKCTFGNAQGPIWITFRLSSQQNWYFQRRFIECELRFLQKKRPMNPNGEKPCFEVNRLIRVAGFACCFEEFRF